MAGRQQQKGYGLQYEDIIPKSEWKDQPEATILTIDLPGFAKEQIKVTYVHTSRMIKVTGERQLADRRWSRFSEAFTVPQNCLVDKIHGSFKNNVLTITLPKETITKTSNVPESSRTVAEKVEKLEEKRLMEEARRKEKEEEAERKRKKLLEEKEELIKKLQEEAKAREMAEERKLQEEAKFRKIAEERKLQEEAKEKAEARKLEEEAKLKEKMKLEEEATLQKKIKESKLVDEARILKAEERKLPEVVYTKSGPVSGTKPGLETKSGTKLGLETKSSPESGTKSKSSSESETKSKSNHRSETKSGLGSGTKPEVGSGGVGEVVKSAEEKLVYLVEKEKKMGKGIMEKIRRKEITSEDKKLMVNVGVAALVIFALGAYVSYTFCSSSSSSSSPSSSSSSTKPE